MNRRREPTEEERALFRSALQDARPIKKPAARPKSGAAKATIKIVAGPESAPVMTARPRPPGGLGGRTAERLRRGVQEPDARIDLHGMTKNAAHRALVTFVRGAAMRGCRLLLIVTGKGLKAAAPDEPFDLEAERQRRGVLRTITPRWLSEPELAGFVADVRTAHRRHGGEGALYVYLRKQAER